MNLRVIKKDIDFLVNDFVSDCLIFSDFHDGEKDEQVLDLITECITMADSLIGRVNFPKKIVANEKGVQKVVRLEGKELKEHYKNINRDLCKGFDELFDKLSVLAKTK